MSGDGQPEKFRDWDIHSDESSNYGHQAPSSTIIHIMIDFVDPTVDKPHTKTTKNRRCFSPAQNAGFLSVRIIYHFKDSARMLPSHARYQG